MTSARWLACSLAVTLFAGCASQSIKSEELYKNDPGFQISKDVEIDDTAKNRQVLDVVARYRKALVQKDFGALKRLVADDYYTNSGTTDTTEDDYGAERLPKIYEHIAKYGQDITYNITIQNLNFERNRAFVRYEFEFSYRSTVGDKPTWDAAQDVNEVELIQKDDGWRIISGL
jgi:ketosteroid isomerase-like protein